MQSLVTVLDLGSVALPSRHPRHADGTSLVQSFVIHHPDGLILVDTGCADDNEIINEMYAPQVVPIVDALNSADIDERDIIAIVNTHLHFDHCGQNRSLPHVPIWVQAAELEAAAGEHFTVPEWAFIETQRLRKVDGDVAMTNGVKLLATPGHTPGHQSVLIELDGERNLIVGQACYTCAEFEASVAIDEDMHGPSWFSAGTASLDRLRALSADQAFFSHDRAVAARFGDDSVDTQGV